MTASGSLGLQGRTWLSQNKGLAERYLRSIPPAITHSPTAERELEHMKRGTAKYVDALYMVVDPYYRSLEAANAGGTLDPSAKSVDVNDFAKAVSFGMTKVNIDTDGRLVWTRVHREHLRDHTDNFDFRKPGRAFIDAYAAFIVHKAKKLRSAGQIDTVRQALRYKEEVAA